MGPCWRGSRGTCVEIEPWRGLFGESNTVVAWKGKGLVANDTVIHIGFLSSEKIFSPDRKASRLWNPGGLSVSLCCVLQRDKSISRRPGLTVLFRSCQFTMDSLIESACCEQTSLSCSHPSGSGPGSLPSVTEAPGSIPTPSGPEQSQCRNIFNRLSIQREGHNRPYDLPRRTRHSALPDSWRGRKRFQRT